MYELDECVFDVVYLLVVCEIGVDIGYVLIGKWFVVGEVVLEVGVCDVDEVEVFVMYW